MSTSNWTIIHTYGKTLMQVNSKDSDEMSFSDISFGSTLVAYVTWAAQQPARKLLIFELGTCMKQECSCRFTSMCTLDKANHSIRFPDIRLHISM